MASASTAFFSRTFNDAVALAVEARNYIAAYGLGEKSQLPVQVRLQASYQAMRVTSRLTQAIAWLLAQKAVFQGEMTERDLASDAYALSGGTLCSDPSGPELEELPRPLRSLLKRSHNLYQRVERLDAQVRRSVTQ